ncbi:hypothetical protein B0H17DRAFT_1220214 [Mycena rosella]|uniref:Uncharacterized protein n=1 Tax=Mycena rosella TaxID=1033263 RepID=A0AAD7FD25_MYCRO|nr:hypothetical protein B0H17DRAFT_1220214 [Mycena rosella]
MPWGRPWYDVLDIPTPSAADRRARHSLDLNHHHNCHLTKSFHVLPSSIAYHAPHDPAILDAAIARILASNPALWQPGAFYAFCIPDTQPPPSTIAKPRVDAPPHKRGCLQSTPVLGFGLCARPTAPTSPTETGARPTAPARCFYVCARSPGPTACTRTGARPEHLRSSFLPPRTPTLPTASTRTGVHLGTRTPRPDRRSSKSDMFAAPPRKFLKGASYFRFLKLMYLVQIFVGTRVASPASLNTSASWMRGAEAIEDDLRTICRPSADGLNGV